MPEKQKPKANTTEQIIMVVFAVGGFTLLSQLIEDFLGFSGIFVGGFCGGIGAGLGWFAVKIFKAIRKK